jgi:hypothetical protein
VSLHPLFLNLELRDVLESNLRQMRSEIENIEPERFLNTAPDDLSKYLIEKYHVNQLKLKLEEWHVQEYETQVDVSQDPYRGIFDRSRPVYIPGQCVEVRIPFEGDRQLFDAKPDSFDCSPPYADVLADEILLKHVRASDTDENLRPLIDQRVNSITKYLVWQGQTIESFNASLKMKAGDNIEDRRTRLLENKKKVASLGIPIKPRSDMMGTYTIPTVRKKATPTLPPATSQAFEPEPTWAMEHYEHAIEVMQNMSLVIERSPSAFQTIDEEGLRQHFLVQLNGHFEGNTTGETFNYSGKTDILLREKDKNVFIAECKFWRGPKVLSETLDQLLSYSSWRDSKTVLLIFNKGQGMTDVLRKIDETTIKHSSFKRKVDWPHESGFRYIFHQRDDANREITITVLVFSIPTVKVKP